MPRHWGVFCGQVSDTFADMFTVGQ
jgi:hypothetical protein